MRLPMMLQVGLTLLTVILIVIMLSSNSNQRVNFGELPSKSQSQTEQRQISTNPLAASIRLQWGDCFRNGTKDYTEDAEGMWNNAGKVIARCQKLEVVTSAIKIQDFQNSDETKHHAMPKKKFPSTIVTLGVGHDTAAEEALLKVLPSTKFFGADPMTEINEKLFSKFGRFFPFAVSDEPGFSSASVLDGGNYITKTVVHVDMEYFLTRLVKKKIYDDIWMDAEGAEYTLFPYFYAGGPLDRNDIIVCQWNIEIHKPDPEQKEQILAFINKITADGRYIFLRSFQVHHIRMFLLNTVDDVCINRYIGKQ